MLIMAVSPLFYWVAGIIVVACLVTAVLVLRRGEKREKGS